MKRIFVLFMLLMFVFGLTLASAATFTNVVSTCSAEDSAAKGGFAGACDNTTGSFLINDDTSLETHTYQKNNYGGIRIQSVNTSITNCNSVTQVFICYKWWRTNGATAQDCDISVDANAGASYTAVNPTCPGTAEPTLITCENVTSLETWSCGSFFGASGTRALAKSELTRVTSGGSTTETGTWDVMYFNVTYTANTAPVINNITASHSTIKGGDTITIYANTTSHGVNDTNADTLYFYCDNSTTPNATNTDCTGGTLSDATYPYALTCTFATPQTDASNIEYCRVYDGTAYSSTVPNVTYTTDSTPPTTSIVSVAGDTSASYFDTVNDGRTDILVSGEANMLCRWSSSDVAYSSMSNTCTIFGTQANCSINDVASQSFTTRYISCADSLLNEQNSSNNLNVQFYLDYTAPTTSDNSASSVQAPNYTVTITESDNVDSDPISYYCSSSSQGCNPTTSINSGGTIAYTASNRGVNYLRYYSVDFAGNTQTIVNKTININQLPILTSASDNAVTIKGGVTVNVSTVSLDSDSGQTLTLFVCSSSGATFSGCTGTEYCSSSGTANLSCTFTSESDSASHTWYAYIFDQLGEVATANPLTGSYTTDSTAPTITLANPLSGSTITQNSVTVTVIVNEPLTNAWYSLNSGATNASMSNTSLYLYTQSNTSIANGNYNLSLWANDSYGNIGSLTGNSFTISVAGAVDTTPPAITILSPGNASYNSLSPLVNITIDEALSWAGYKLNGGVLTNLTSATTTNWYTTLSLSQESTNNLTIFTNDTSNNQANKTIILYADSLAPRYSLAQASPSPANVSQNVNCSITFTDGFNIASVKISENSAGLHENHTISFSGTSGTASYVIVGSRLTNPGAYQCIFYAQDTAGNSNSTPVAFNVNDVTAPTVIVTSPTNGGTYNQLSVLLSLATSEAASSAWYSLDGAANVTMGNTSSTNWNYTLTGLTSVHTYSVVFYANDSSGNIGTSGTKTFTVNTGLADTIPPVLTSTIINASYKTLASFAFNVSSNENLNWSGYKLNSGSLTNLTNISATLWNGTLSGLGNESTNTIIIYGNDSVNNQGNSTLTFYVDTVAPRFLDVSASPSVANETQSVVCNVYVNDTFGLGSVKIGENATISGTFLNHTVDLSSAGWANYTMTNVQKGGYGCIFYATDVTGNTNSTSTTFIVNDVTPPVISINSPLNQGYSTNSILLSITSDEDMTSANYSLDNGVTNVSLTGSGKSWSKTVSFTDGSKNLIFYGIDNSGNLGTASVAFTVDISVNDVTPPTITIWNPVNGSYYTSASVLLNITTDEALSWAGLTNNSGALRNLGNVSTTNWNATITLAEGQHNLTFYANDSSTNKNQKNSSINFYVDLTNPSVNSFTCTNPVNDSADVNCSASVSDAVGLNYAIIGYNATGSWQNSSQIPLSGTSTSLSYVIPAVNTTPGSFVSQIYLYDLSGRSNLTTSYTIDVSDDSYPQIYNITYWPNTADALDPGVMVNVNATVVENYKIGSVKLMYKELAASSWTSVAMDNNSAIANGSSASVVYNASFVPGNGTYVFKINATDLAGNMNVSANYTLVVQNDTSFWNGTDIPAIKSFTYAQRSGSNTLGNLYLNNTGDNTLNLTITLTSSSLSGRLSINYTNNASMNYSLSSGNNVTISVEVNTTDLTANPYSYTISVSSEAGTTIYEKQMYIQTAEGPYLVTAISQYSSSVTRGQTDIELVAQVSNFGSQDASGVILTWSLPSAFSLSSGSLTRNLGNLPIGLSATNTIKVSVSSSAADSSVNISANATATPDLSSLDSKSIIITDPLTVIVTTPGTGGGSGGGGGAATPASIVYSKIIEIVRGEQDGFNIEVNNQYFNSSLEDLTMTLDGFPQQYIEISPSKISKINSKETGKFTVKLKIPSYKESYEEHTLKAVISGSKVDGTAKTSYTETQNIKLIIQEVSKEKSNLSLAEAEKAILEMKNAGFNLEEVNKLLEQAKSKLSENRNKEAQILSQQIISIRNKAIETDNLIRRVAEALQNPKKSSLLVGNVVKDFNGNDKTIPLKNLITGKTIFASSSVVDMLNLAIVAFERGDYDTAVSRATEARNLLILERKGNFTIFLYLYWPFIILGLLIFSATGVLSYKTYKKSSITRKIQDMDSEENNIQTLILSAQRNYFSGKISTGEYHRIMNQHQNKLAKIKQERLNLRNKRIKMLKPQQILQDLGMERIQVENEIKKLQEQFYRDKKISENEYNTEFKILNERLAEIEGESITLEMLKKNESGKIQFKNTNKELERAVIKSEKEVKKHGGVRIFFLKIAGFLKSPFNHINKIKENKRLKEEAKIREKIKSMNVL